MSVKIGINGFGRMGRLGFRAGWENKNFSIVQVNETATDATGSAHLLKFDSVHGTWSYDTSATNDYMTIDNQIIHYSSNQKISDTDWSNCDIVIEATGVHHKKTRNFTGLF